MGDEFELTLKLCKLTKYEYYKKLGKRKKAGRKPTCVTRQINGHGDLVEVAEEAVIGVIINTLLLPETSYGYRDMTAALQHEGFIVNYIKLYRRMYKYQLLGDRHKRAARNYVKHRGVNLKRPLDVLEMDIKFQWVIEHQCYVLILTVIDCFTRKVLYWTVAYSIKQAQIKDALEQIILHELQPAGLLEQELTLELRNDNDTRFAAKTVQEYFAKNHIQRVFTHPYMLQENGHLESFHAILGRSLEIKEYMTITDLEKKLIYFYYAYNNVRLHGSLKHLNPNAFIKFWEKELIEDKPHKKIKHKYNIQLRISHYKAKPNGEIRIISEETKVLLAEKNRRISTLNN